ncbi:hypothetical protein D3C71_1811550 [compost metagenome]
MRLRFVKAGFHQSLLRCVQQRRDMAHRLQRIRIVLELQVKADNLRIHCPLLRI